MRSIVGILLILLSFPAEARWYKGNTHVHTNESDGDASPADVVRWYASHGYDFIVITDHDMITRYDLEPGFIAFRGSEITDRLPKRPLHVNAIGIDEPIKPQGGKTAVEVMQRNIDAVLAADGLVTVNHPNFGWALSPEEILQLERFHFLEITSGHPLVNAEGPPSVESTWDALLTKGKRVWGIATDDSHHFRCPPPTSAALPGQAWIVVRAEGLKRATILDAMKRGDFYMSTGVELSDVGPGCVTIVEKGAAKYRTTFIGRGGRVLHETTDLDARYTIRGDEGYVRARVVDSNGLKAWTQPFFNLSRADARDQR